VRPLSVLLCAAGLAVVASGAGAQTVLPSWGCNASPSCRQNGFSTVTGQYKEHTGVLVDVSWDHGPKFDLLRHPTPGEESPKLHEQWFHVHPPAPATPAAGPQPAAPTAPPPPVPKDAEAVPHSPG
jgi:hypothetical protein